MRTSTAMWTWLAAYMANDRLKMHNMNMLMNPGADWRSIPHHSQAKKRKLARQRGG